MQPEKIGIYEIKSELGRGGMATVYRGYDPRFEREVAVKVLPPELLHSDPQFRVRFEREAKIIAQLEHPSIVPVYDVGEENNQPYFVMRYMKGGSLSERIKAGIFSVENAVKILERIAPGLDEAHARGFVHRDLKPSNILFDGRDSPYISDFGIAKIIQGQSGTMTGSGIIGTPAYMAPEQASGDQVDGRADVYALGIILFEMLTGKQPYEADTPMAVAIKHVTDPVPDILNANPKLPLGMDAIIQKALAKNRDDRFSTAVDLVDSLRTVASGQEHSSEPRTVKDALPTLKGAQPKTIKSSGRIPEVRAKKGFSVWFVIVPLVLLGLLGGGGYALFSWIDRPVETEARVTETSEAAPPATETLSASASVETVILAPPTATETPSAPVSTAVGGADKIALVANNEIWLMNVDGTELEQLTFDGASKNDLQWLPDGETILFLSGKTVKYYNISTDTVDTLTSFPSEVSLNSFQVSHAGTQVMIAMSNNIFVVPFDFETMRSITNRNQLIKMEGGCILPTDGTKAALRVKETRWSVDDLLVAWLFKGNDAGNSNLQAEQVSVFDITACKPELIDLRDNFPGTRFIPAGYQNRELPDLDWDGLDQFVFNTSRRNNGWGELYNYNWEVHKSTQLQPAGACCYRDARWSPDGTYMFFEFQDSTLGANAITVLYYVPVGEMNTGANFKPITMPEGFFKNPKEGAQAALRPAKP